MGALSSAPSHVDIAVSPARQIQQVPTETASNVAEVVIEEVSPEPDLTEDLQPEAKAAPVSSDDDPTPISSEDKPMSPNEAETIILPGFLKLPQEIRQHILSYIIDPKQRNARDAILMLKHRSAVPLLRVCKQFRTDVDYLHHKWRKEYNLQDLLCDTWSDVDQKAYDKINKKVKKGKASESTVRLLYACDTFRAQRHEMRHKIEAMERNMAMQREVLKELIEENERLTLSAEMVHVGMT
jgi:hypothetical protein